MLHFFQLKACGLITTNKQPKQIKKTQKNKTKHTHTHKHVLCEWIGITLQERGNTELLSNPFNFSPIWQHGPLLPTSKVECPQIKKHLDVIARLPV